jgi:AbrB family looped-hinge helix DNA binding protein
VTGFATTKISSKGQVVLPKEARDSLRLGEGTILQVHWDKKTIILEPLLPPSKEELEDMFAWARRRAKALNLRKRDVQGWIDEGRYRKK